MYRARAMPGVRGCAAGLVAALLSACAHVAGPRLPIEDPGAPQALLVVARPTVPAIRYAIVSKAGQAARGAGTGALEGAAAATPAGPLAPVVMPFTAAIGAVVGAVGGPLLGPGSARIPERSAAAISAGIDDAVRDLGLPERLATEVAREARMALPYRTDLPGRESPADALASRRAPGYGAILEVAVREIGFVGESGVSRRVAFYMLGEAATWDAATGALASRRGVVYQSEFHGDLDWARDDAHLLAAEVARATAALAQRVVEAELLGAEQETPHRGTGEILAPQVCGLAPLQPAPRTTLHLLGRMPARHLAPGDAGSRTPLLEWQPQVPGIDPEAVGDLAYDLRIWRADGPDAGVIVYERFGLREARHRVESPLPARATFGWSVRARYQADGRRHALRWSAAVDPMLELHPTVYEASRRTIRAGDGFRELRCPRPAFGLSGLGDGGTARASACDCLDFIPPANAFSFTTPD